MKKRKIKFSIPEYRYKKEIYEWLGYQELSSVEKGYKTTVTFEIDEIELTGDEKILAISSKVKSVTFNSEYAELSLDVLSALSGGNVSVTTQNSADTATFSFEADDKPGYFQLQAKIDGTDSISGGDCHICIYKAKVTAMPLNGVQNDFATYTFDGKGVFTEYLFNSKSKLIDIDFHQVATPLAYRNRLSHVP